MEVFSWTEALDLIIQLWKASGSPSNWGIWIGSNLMQELHSADVDGAPV